ncbi:hypothetical protein [Segniliparus rugosus]|uniref:Uncharacterized protein n=1 Tax=Segniliparus rugosus (strain ATCC BAA-974 / DSM 45345 / CCUG 50838 / CIP 108380 / JCM 13579 / CDC 945) TaxID=679197 RepID=U1LN19_SEGRC|nr:hypothetical protein [Segniliparus rugosus]ERG69341.1 hypothetical protein HMPREF9336_04232 [Segniliparus rugosus ATCC BAA-974]
MDTVFEKLKARVGEIDALLVALGLAWMEDVEDHALFRAPRTTAVRRGASLHGWGRHGETDAYVDFVFAQPSKVSLPELRAKQEAILTFFEVARGEFERAGGVVRLLLSDEPAEKYPARLLLKQGFGVDDSTPFEHFPLDGGPKERGRAMTAGSLFAFVLFMGACFLIWLLVAGARHAGREERARRVAFQARQAEQTAALAAEQEAERRRAAHAAALREAEDRAAEAWLREHGEI